MVGIIKDKIIEKNRYDKRAINLLKSGNKIGTFESASIPLTLRSPYISYEENIKKLIQPTFKVLEIGAGTGLHTNSLVKTGAHVTATDISKNSLRVLENNLSTFKGKGKLSTLVADMEQLPFENESFDVVTSAGSLSYGVAEQVDNEIRRVIKPGGFFICVDSLNNNPVYRLNRFIHYLKKERSKMTLLNMPTIQRISAFTAQYSKVEVKYFGSISYLMPLVKLIFGSEKAKKISDFIDKLFKAKKSAFKFVLIAKV